MNLRDVKRRIIISFGLSYVLIICIYGIIDSLLSWVFGGCGTLIDRKNWNDVGSRKEWGAEAYSYMESALPSHWMYLMVFASTLEELTTQLWWKAVKSPGVCVNMLPCFVFALSKTLNWVTASASVLCLPFCSVISTAGCSVADGSELALISLDLLKSHFSKSQPRIHPEDPGFLEISVCWFGMPPEKGYVQLTCSHGIPYESSCISSCLPLSLRINSPFQWPSSETVFSHG